MQLHRYGDVIEAVGLRMMLGANDIANVAKLDGTVQGLGTSDANGNLTVPVCSHS